MRCKKRIISKEDFMDKIFTNVRSMKFAVIGLLLMVVFGHEAYSQNSWLSTKGPKGGSLYAIVIKQNKDIFVGSYGNNSTQGIFHSTDNGDTWIRSVTTESIWSLAKNSNGDLFAGTDGGGLYLSTDDGSTWVQKGPINKVIRSLFVNSGDSLYAGMAGGELYLSTNSGASWQSKNSGLPANDVLALTANSSGDLFAGLWNSGVYRSTDGGTTWTQNDTGLTDLRVRALSSNSRGTLFAGTDGGGVFRTTDNGETWTQCNSGLTWTYTYALTIDVAGNIFVGTYGGVYQSKDNGDNWLIDTSGLGSAYVRSLAIDSGGTIFAGTNDGLIFRTGSTTDVKEVGRNIPASFNLSQNYPNPFNPSTNIKFQVPQNSLVTIKVYDLLGKEVATLVHQEMKPGTYSAAWNAEGISSGVYFYKLHSGNIVETKQMLLLK